MPQLLLEFLSEEIPARMQARAEADLARLLMDKLTGAGFLPEGVKAFSTPRRLAAVVEGLPLRQPDVREERKGPRVGAPDKAIEGFLRGAGLKRIEDARTVEDAKGAFYVADIEKKGAETAAVIAQIVPEIVRGFAWPKSMRSGDSDLYWVRPLQSVLCSFDGEAVAIDLPGVASGRSTEGHRFMAPGRVEVRRFEDYRDALQQRFVVLDRAERKAIIAREAKTLCEARNLELVDDPGLLEEVTGLAEWPVVLMGDMDPAFLDLPGEVIRLSMRTHQRYFAVRDPKTKKLAPHFVVVANVEAKDGGKEIAHGNAKVLSARLNDARFFWDLDRKKGLEDKERAEKLDEVVFHKQLGTVHRRVKRIEALSLVIASSLKGQIDVEAGAVAAAAQLCKRDLVTEVVGEFPELQGYVGRRLAELSGATPEIAEAIEDHYKPLGPNDRVPSSGVSIAVALADKLDALVGFWAINEKPTGSSDAFGLRRAALGVIRILATNQLKLSLRPLVTGHVAQFDSALFSTPAVMGLDPDTLDAKTGAMNAPVTTLPEPSALAADLIAFLTERLKVQLRDQGKRHDLVDAVFALGDDDLVRIATRVEALGTFLGTGDGANLLAGYKRAANIIAAEDKKGALKGVELAGAVDAKLLKEPAEKGLAAALDTAAAAAKAAVEKEDFAGAMRALAQLRAPVDAFFEAVLVNAPEPELRANRLKLLNRIRTSLGAVADFSKIEG